MGKMDDNDEQIEEVEKLLKQMEQPNNKAKKPEEGLDFTELLKEKLDEIGESATQKEAGAEETAAEEPVKDDSASKEPVQEEPGKEEPVQEEPGEEEPVQEEPGKEEPVQEEPGKEEPVQEELDKKEPVKEEPVKEEPSKTGLVKEETVKKEAPQKKSARNEAVSERPAKPTQTKSAPTKPKQEKKAEEEKKEPGSENNKKTSIAGTLTRKMVFCISLGVFAFALTGLLVLLWGYYTSQREYAKINDDYVVIGTATAPENSDGGTNVVVDVSTDDADNTDTDADVDSDAVPFLDITVDERKLKALNEDYSFYIVIPGTNVQYPVVQGEDNDHYLRYTYSNQENTAGSIQVDYRTDRDTYLQTFNTILHGHNRQDGTMFSDLANYMDESFRDENPYIYIILDSKEYVYEIFAFYAMEPVAVCYNPHTSDDVYLEFINENNTYSCDIEVTLEDHIISLYTCNEDSSMRYLVHAVLREIYDLS